METGKGRSRRQASPRPTPRRAGQSIARHAHARLHDYRADLRDELKGMALAAVTWLACAVVGALLAWCAMCPDYEPISRAEWEAMCLQGVAE